MREIHLAVSGYFARAEPRLRALHYMLGVAGLGTGTRRSIASGVDEQRTDGAQRLLTKARWDENAVRAKLVDVVRAKAGPGGGLYVLEVSFPKRGQAAVGTERRLNTACGRMEICQNAVLMFYGAVDGCLFLVDADLYVPRGWLLDPDRARQAHTGYRSRTRIVADMVDRAAASGLASGRIALSFQCPDKPELLGLLQRRRMEYLTWLTAGEFRDLAGQDRQNGMVLIDEPAPRALTAWFPQATHYRSCSSRALPGHELDRRIDELRRAHARWQRIQQQTRIGQYEVRGWRGWHRHMTLSMAAQIASQLARPRPQRPEI